MKQKCNRALFEAKHNWEHDPTNALRAIKGISLITLKQSVELALVETN